MRRANMGQHQKQEDAVNNVLTRNFPEFKLFTSNLKLRQHWWKSERMGVSRPRIRVLYFHPTSRKQFTLRTCPRSVLVSPGSRLPSTADSSPPPRAPLPAHLSGDLKRNGKIRRSRRTRYQAAAGEI